MRCRTTPGPKYKIGQTVFVVARDAGRNLPRGTYVVTKVLPDRDDEREYRIRSVTEPHEHVVRETQLRTTG